jgi:TetR/AcrR family transcriptional regulator
MKAKRLASTRRIGVESSETRARLIEAAARIVKKEGYAAVTAGRLAEKFGLKRHAVHYYFRTIEELMIAVMRREAEEVRRLLSQSLESQDPLTAIWERCRAITATTKELLALASYRKAIRIEIKRDTEEFRGIFTQALVHYLERRGLTLTVPPVVAIVSMQSLAQNLAVEASLGISLGHVETKAVIEEWLRAFTVRGELVAIGLKPVHTQRAAR